MPGIGIISNPFAKVNKRDPEHNTLMWYVLGNKGQFEVTNSLQELSQVCQEFQARGIDTIGIVGGDGTISLTLSAIEAAYGPQALPRILLLRGGTVNVAASNLGIYGKPKDVMADFLEAYHSGKPLAEMPISTLKANGRLGFLFANGIAANFLREFYRNKTNALGAGLYFAKVMTDTLAGGKLTGDLLKIDSKEALQISTYPNPLLPQSEGNKTFSMVFVSTLPRMPFGIPLYRMLKPGASHAEMIAFSSKGRDLFPQAARVLLGKQMKSEGVAKVLFEKALIQAQESHTYSLDGDLLEAPDGKIELNLGPTFVFCSPYGKVL
jgi:hypothetical protein